MHLPARASSIAALLAVLGCGCGQVLELPPLPADLAALSAPARAEIEDAHARASVAPDSAAAWTDLGAVYQANRVLTLAARCYERARTLDPSSAKCNHLLGIVRADQGEIVAAISAAGRALELDPSSAPAAWRQGSYEVAHGDLAAAARAFEHALACDPTHPGGPTGLARVALLEGRPADALALLESLAEREPVHRYVHDLMATALAALSRGEEARIHARLGTGTSGEPRFPDPWEEEMLGRRAESYLKKALRLMSANRHAEALPILFALSLDTEEPFFVLSNLALCQEHIGRVEDAFATSARALELEPESLWIRSYRSRLCERLGDLDAALAEVERGLALEPGFARLLARKGELSYRRGRFEDAIDAWRAAWARDGRDRGILLGAGACELELGRFAEARQTFTEASLLEPPLAEAFVGLAEAELRLRNRAEARAAATRASELGPHDRTLLTRVLQELDAPAQEPGEQE